MPGSSGSVSRGCSRTSRSSRAPPPTGSGGWSCASTLTCSMRSSSNAAPRAASRRRSRRHRQPTPARALSARGVATVTNNGDLTDPDLIPPHGGQVVNRVLLGAEREDALARAAELPTIALDARALSDLELLAVGALSPLDGFMRQDDYQRVVHEMRLGSGLAWPLPITLAAHRDTADGVKEGSAVALVAPWGEVVGILHLEEKFACDPREEAHLVYGTEDRAHPGVAYLMQSGDVLLGGRIDLINQPPGPGFEAARLDPARTRRLFRERGWRTVAGFQTRNPIHRSHEYIQKCALELTDGLLIHPLVGQTKLDDVPSEIRFRCYQALIRSYFPPQRVILALFPGAMRYAGPREAVFHALVRKNYGCTHFIVGRDAAGVGSYYAPYAAHELLRSFGRDDLGIEPLFFMETFFCRRCEAVVSVKTCPHEEAERVVLSGTRVRELLRRGDPLPPEFTRPEVADVLAGWARGG
ncbi:MAG: sulfate adenylyltransferase [Elusimicrobia bacterium]|nr:sulfate adenylyltransferase [Elusimicrobiota bacterium]